MTPQDAARHLEQLSPAFVKLTLVELLEWQASKGKSLVNLGWYLNCMFFKEQPREKQTKDAQQARRKIAALVKQAGG